ncbi:hypothetical protein GCM10007978_37940 [Shewanella hanedai]|nr:hypothetical protein GCM10007978_37940 [Shewanella hanedai]
MPEFRDCNPGVKTGAAVTVADIAIANTDKLKATVVVFVVIIAFYLLININHYY